MVQANWTFVPVVSITDDSTVDVIGALALVDMSTVSGNNITAVWYSNPHQANTKWAAKTWQVSSQWEAIKWVKASYGISDSWDTLWPTYEDPPADTNVTQAVDYDKGLMVGDPFADDNDDVSHDELVAALVSAGYQAASIPVDQNGSCDAESALPALEDVTTLNVLFALSDEELQDAFDTSVSADCGSVAAVRWRPVPTTTPPWAPRPAVPAMPPYWITPPTTVTPVLLVPSRTGWWSDYTCVVAGSMCVCTAYGFYLDPTGKLIWSREVCSGPAGGGCPPPSAPPSWNPTTPPGTPGLPTYPCTTRVYY